jgi:predicted metal-dependent peptidase
MLAIGKQLTPEQRLSKAVVDIMGNPKYVALAGVLMIGDRTVVDDHPTACTNGRDEMYGRDFVDSLNDAELRFLVLHEVYHKLYKHLTTWRHLHDQDAQLTNMACDYVINIKIADDNRDGWAVMPQGGCLDVKYRDWDSAAVFNDLRDNGSPQDSQQGSGDTTGTQNTAVGDDGGEDGTTGTQNTAVGDAGDGDGSGDNGSPQGFDSHDWDGAAELTPDEKRELARDVDEAIRQGALIAGKLGSGGDRDLEDLLTPQIDWREVLREFIQTTCAGSDYSTWQRPNRRYVSSGYYMPSGISEQVGELVIAVDTSGSIGQLELTAFMSEIQAICDTVHPDHIRLLYWDTRVCQDEKYDMHQLDELVKTTKPKGGGGTNVECVTDYLTEHGVKPQAAIVLTDGYLGGSWGQWSCPVLWCILDNKSAKPDTGKHVNITSREM